MDKSLKGAVLLLPVLVTGCMVSGDFDFTYGPTPPDPIDAADGSSDARFARVSTVIYKGKPAWDLSWTLEAAGAKAEDDLDFSDGYAVIKSARIDPPARIGVSWDVQKVSTSLVITQDFGAGFDGIVGLGLSRADLDIKYAVSDGRVLNEGVTLGGLNLQLGLGVHPADWLECTLRLDAVLKSTPLSGFDAFLIFRPRPAVGIIAGWRSWAYYDDGRSGSELDLSSSGPLFGLEFRF